MPIVAKTGQHRSVTEGWRALELFTDRLRATRRFAAYLNEDPPPESILFFCADGGTGKSLLLRFLAERCTVRVSSETWKEVSSLPDQDFRDHLLRAGDARPLPHATLDLGAQPRGEDRPQEAFSGLMMLRRALAVHKIAFPLFDFACLRYLQLTSGLSQERIRLLFPASEHGFIGDIVRSLSLVHPGPEALLGLIERRMGKSFAVYGAKRRLDRASVENIERLEPRRELLAELPHLFAEDLNVHLVLPKSPPRVVLFFDSHDEIWGAAGTSEPEELYFERDEWLRRLLASLDLEGGIVAVVAGRNPPRWPTAPKVPIPAEYLDIELIEPLPTIDAEAYLARAGVADAALRAELVDYAGVAPGLAHPLYLGLCVDVVLAAQRAGTPVTAQDFRVRSPAGDQGRVLLSRLLRYVDTEISYAVRALSACRAFDQGVFVHLGRKLNFNTTEPAFEALRSFSFVWRDERWGSGFYRLHNLLRRILRAAGDEVVRRADAVLETYYAERAKDGDVAAWAEAAYHANQTDPERGAAMWLDVCDRALQFSEYDLARTLLEVRDEMIVPDERVRGRVATATGRFLAEGCFRYDEACTAYEEALAAFDRALAVDPVDARTHTDRAGALFRLGESQAARSLSREASTSHREAISAADRAVRFDADLAEAHRNRAAAYMRLGDLKQAAGQRHQALDCYREAITASQRALSLAPDDARAHNIAGLAQLGEGRAEAERGRPEKAAAAFYRAIAAFEEAVSRTPAFAYAHFNAGTTCRALGELQAHQARHDDAEHAFALAVIAFEDALSASPHYAKAHAGRGGALVRLGREQRTLGRTDDAAASCRRALLACQEAVRLAPGYAPAHVVQGEALVLTAELQLAGGRTGESEDSIKAARAACDQAVSLAPEDPDVLALVRVISSFASTTGPTPSPGSP